MSSPESFFVVVIVIVIVFVVLVPQIVHSIPDFLAERFGDERERGRAFRSDSGETLAARFAA